MKIWTVRLHGKPIKTFTDKSEASKFMVEFLEMQQAKLNQLDYLDEAVLKSDLKEANEVIKYIMEKKK